MSKVTIILTGVGICYLKDDKWKVIFPFDKNDCHKVQFEYAGEYIPLNQSDLNLEVTVKNGKNQARSATSPNMIIDLTEPNFHQKLSLRADWQKNAAFMEIPNALVSLHKPLKSKYQLKKDTNVIREYDGYAFSIKAEIELEADGEVIFNVEGNKNFPQTFKADGDNHIIVINNNCFGNPSFDTGDLEMLYELVFDIAPEDRFTIERSPAFLPEAETTHLVNETTEQSGAKTPLVSVKSHNPDYGEIGLPCYFTTASNPDGLP